MKRREVKSVLDVDYVLYALFGIIGLLIVVGALVWWFKFHRKTQTA